MDKWEYKTIFMGLKRIQEPNPQSIDEQQVMTDQQLTELGSQGWELVNVVSLTRFLAHGLGQFEVTWGIQYIFKRLKQS